MADTSTYLGITEFVDGLASELMASPFKPRYKSEESLRHDVAKVVRKFISLKLDPLGVSYNLWEDGVDLNKIEPVFAFGIDFRPDLVIEVGEFPTVAIESRFIKKGESSALKISSAIGLAMIYSRLYPSVIAFVLDRGEREEYKHWLDREFKMELWTRYKIKLIIQQ